jgi:outer membrane protein
MKRILIAFFIASLSISYVAGQKKWTLQECIQYALDNNIQIKRQQLLTNVGEKDYNQSKYNILPNLGANADHTWYDGRRFDQTKGSITTNSDMTDEFSVSSGVTLFSGFQLKNTIEQNKYNLEKSLQDYQKAKNDISLQIATVFLQILSNQEALGIADNQLKTTTLQVEKVKKLVNAGSKAKGDLLQIIAQEATEKYNVVNAKNNLKISYLTLTQILELKSNEEFSIVTPDTLIISDINILSQVDDIYKTAEANLPEIKSAEFALKSSEKGLDIIKGKYYPTLGLSAGFISNYSKSLNYAFFKQIKDNNSNYVGLNLTIPIFNKFQTRTNVGKANIQVLDATYSLGQTKKSLYQEVQKAHADATASFERYNSANEAVTSNEESFKYIQQKFDVGLVSSVDYNISKNDLLKAKANYIQAKYEYMFKLKVIDFYKGLPLQL